MLRVVLLSLSAARTDLPPSVSGFGSVTGLSGTSGLGTSCPGLAAVLTNTVNAGRVFTKVLRFVEFSCVRGSPTGYHGLVPPNSSLLLLDVEVQAISSFRNAP